MAIPVFHEDVILDDSRFLVLGFKELDRERFNAASAAFGDGVGASELMDFDAGAAVRRLREDPDLGALFLAMAPGDGSILWSGNYSSSRTPEGQSFGVRVERRREGDAYVGDNAFGRHLDKVRQLYRNYLKEAVVAEVPVREGQVTVDFTRRGAVASDIEMDERDADRYIHVDVYRPARFRFDSSRDGTTGHASRRSGSEVDFQKWECPFGVSRPAPLVVGSAAEASLLYERALRGELDWKALFDDLYARGFIKKMNDRDRDAYAKQYAAQFSWMREQVCTDVTLRDRTIVADSLLVPDASFGRSQYDPEVAPSPAHVLARYINNPVLLFAPSRSGVLTALSVPGKREPERFAFPKGADAPSEVHVLVVGSDTIGGRDPGHRATSSQVLVKRTDRSGAEYVTREKQYKIPQKTEQEKREDYNAFASRMDSVLAGVPEGTKVVLVSGNASSMGDGVGVGTPRLVERYVSDRGGAVSTWRFGSRKGPGLEAPKDGREVTNPALSAVLMEHFGDCYPVLAGKDDSVSFLLDANDEESRVTFRAGSGLIGDCAVCLTVKEDANNRNLLSMGSLAVSNGIPVVHVQENRTEDRQRAVLSSGSVVALSRLSGEVELERTMFVGDEPGRWDLGSVNRLSFVDAATGVAVPFVSNVYPGAVSVAGESYHSALGAFVALVAQQKVGDAASFIKVSLDIRQHDGLTPRLMEIYRSLGDVSPLLQERAMRQAVRMMAAANAPFTDALLDLDGKDIVMPVSGAGADSVLFVDLEGRGLNRFGRVLSDERDRMKAEREARRFEEEEERRQLLEDANRRQALLAGTRASGEKVKGGLPGSLAESRDAVWFLGTNTPDQLVSPDDYHSFEMWNDENGADPLVREKAMSPYVDDGEGGRIDNDFVFLFASDLQAVMGRRTVVNRADSHDLTGCRRVDPKTGVEFPCAFGIPVRFNNKGNEFFNSDGLPCSYRLDNDASRFVDSVVLADSAARAEAFRHGMSLCLLGRERERDGSVYYPLGNVFLDEQFDRKKGHWTENPHRSPLNADTVRRYISLLENGRDYPLNCIVLPGREYRAEDLPSVVEERRREVREAREAGIGARGGHAAGEPSLYRADREAGIVRPKRFVSAQGRFLADLGMSLRIANATAVALGVPLRFPLDRDGRIDLGPGVPEELRDLAEKKIDSFIGVVREEDMLQGNLPYIERIPMYEAARHAPSMVRTGTELRIRPNDLVYAFGQYDFEPILSGQVAPLHEMAFRMEDGTVFSLVDTKLSRGVDLSTLNRYLDYSKNDIRRFFVRTTAPGREQEFLAAVRSYVDRAQRVRVTARLVNDSHPDVKDEGLEGYVNLLSSNSDQFKGVYSYEVNIMGVPLTTVEGVYTSLLLRHADKADRENVQRIADAEKAAGDDSAALKASLADFRTKVIGKGVSEVEKEYGIRFRERARFLVDEAKRNTDHDIGREASFFNATGRIRQDVVRDGDGNVVARTESVEDREVDGGNVSGGYWGKVDAKDGFSGYAQISYQLPDGSRGDWFTVKDLELAKDMVLSMVNRTYRTDSRVLPSEQVLNMLMVAEAVRDAGARFRDMEIAPLRQAEADDKTVEIERGKAGGPVPGKDDGSHLDAVREFRGEYGFLSNMWKCPVAFEGTVYPSAENAFQAAKCLEPGERTRFVDISPSEARKVGRSVRLRGDWEDVKESVMRSVVADKFGRNPALAGDLLATGSSLLYEGNAWGDTFWGVDLETGKGENRLGGILMEVRASLAERKAQEVHEPKLYVSYYGSGALPEDAFLVQISTSRPKGMEVDVELEALYPDYRTMVGPHKEGRIDDAEYSRRYREKVLDARKDDILGYVGQLKDMARGEGKDVYMLCYERPGDFCHRYLVSNFLNENGIDCQENPADRKLYREGRVKLVNDNVPSVAAEPELPFPSDGPKGVRIVTHGGGWDRGTVAKDRSRLYVFTDNTDRTSGSGVVDRGSGYYRRYGNGKDDLFYPTTTSAVVRGLDNAMPVSTQRWYHEGAKGVSGRWQDVDADEFRRVVSAEFADLRDAVASGRYEEVVFPSGDGLFGGKISAITEERVPVLYGILKEEYDGFVRYVEGLGVAESVSLGAAAPDVPSPSVVITESSGGYAQRTRENANADDVDFTIAFAVNFNTRGERLTADAAGDSYIAAPLTLRQDGKGLDLSDEVVGSLVDRVYSLLPEEFQHGEPMGLNIAGNGLYSVAPLGCTQEQGDEVVTRVLAGLRDRGVVFSSFRSGGQTFVDEAAYAAGTVLGVQTTIHAPKGYQFRGADGKDVRSEKAFRERFVDKDLSALREKVAGVSRLRARRESVMTNRKGI